MRRLFFLICALAAAGPAWGACPTGSTCETFQQFSGVIKLVATGNQTIDTPAFIAALAKCGPNTSISFVGIMMISPPGLGDPPPGCTISGYDEDPYDGGAGQPGSSMLKAVSTTTPWPTGTAVIGSNDGVTYQHFTIDGNNVTTGNCVNVHNVQGFTALTVHVYQCLIGWNVISDGNDTSHSQTNNRDIQIWSSQNMRNGIAGFQASVANGGGNTDIQLVNESYSQNGTSFGLSCGFVEPGNIVVLGGTVGLIQTGSRSEDAFCPGNRGFDFENASRITLFGVGADSITTRPAMYLKNVSDIAYVASSISSAGVSTGPYFEFAGAIDRLITFGSYFHELTGCVFTTAGASATVTNSALYEQPYGTATPLGSYCDSATAAVLAPFFISNDRAFP